MEANQQLIDDKNNDASVDARLSKFLQVHGGLEVASLKTDVLQDVAGDTAEELNDDLSQKAFEVDSIVEKIASWKAFCKGNS